MEARVDTRLDGDREALIERASRRARAACPRCRGRARRRRRHRHLGRDRPGHQGSVQALHMRPALGQEVAMDEPGIESLSFEAALAAARGDRAQPRDRHRAARRVDRALPARRPAQAPLRGAAQGGAGADRPDFARRRGQAGRAPPASMLAERSRGGGRPPRRRRARVSSAVDRPVRASSRRSRRRPRPPVRGDAPCRHRRRQAASPVAHRGRGAPVRPRRAARAPRRRGDRGDPRLLADPRRSAVHGRRRPAPRQADRPQGV